MLAWIVNNGSSYQTPMQEQVAFYQDSFEKNGVRCMLIRNEHLIFAVQESGEELPYPRPDFVLFWSKDVVLAQLLQMKGIPVFNSAQAIAAADNKLDMHIALQKKRIDTPKTIPFPMLYPLYTPETTEVQNLLDRVEDLLGYPIVLKEAFGSFGMQVYLAHTRAELEKVYLSIRYKPGLFQAFIASASGVDMRIQVVGNDAVAAMRRVNRDDFRSNVNSGGHVEKCLMPDTYAKCAVEASLALSLDFSGIDILAGPHGEPIVCEVNSNAFVRNISLISGVNVPEKILTHIRHHL